MADAVIIDTDNEESTDNVEVAEIVEEVSDGIANAIDTVQAVPTSEIPPPASQGEYALSAAMLAAIERLENVATVLVAATASLNSTAIVTEEIAETLEEITENESGEVAEQEFIDTIEEDVPPSNRRNNFRSKWKGAK
jgi:hypothetical protein